MSDSEAMGRPPAETSEDGGGRIEGAFLPLSAVPGPGGRGQALPTWPRWDHLGAVPRGSRLPGHGPGVGTGPRLACSLAHRPLQAPLAQ